ncbi:Uncharacterised protein [Mycobacteroides abscessus subsp. abscessus]|nr:Uncharacterised protein [Mycobacteroides abscessus subsp. abscessus]SHT73869.1 Uncharacterised protein [Mycobacteroides abscessus subsp. abscessus]
MFGSRCRQFGAISPRRLSVSTSLTEASDTTSARWLPSRTLRACRAEPPLVRLISMVLPVSSLYCLVKVPSTTLYSSRVGS